MLKWEEEIHTRALMAAQGFKRAEASLIDALIAVEKDRIFLQLGQASLYRYALDVLELSEAVASSAITVARKSSQIPELRAAISRGSIGISKAKKIASVIKPENQSVWIKKAETLTSRALEKEVAKVNPKVLTPERSTYVNETRLQVTFGMEESDFERLRAIQDQVSQSCSKPVTLEETILELMSLYTEKKDPVAKAERVLLKKKASESVKTQAPGTVPGTTAQGATQKMDLKSAKLSKAIPAASLHVVNLRDQRHCQYETQSGICGESRFTDVHHKIERCQGGSHAPENLITLCRSHHQFLHRERSM